MNLQHLPAGTSVFLGLKFKLNMTNVKEIRKVTKIEV